MKIILFLLFSVSIAACSHSLCESGLYCSAQEQLDRAEPQWNQWLGKTKDERIKALGPPDKCETLTTGEEVCEWRSGGVTGGGSYSNEHGSSSVSSWEHRRIFTYDRDHIARSLSYSGSLGQRHSKPMDKLPNKSPPEGTGN
jgi:hypothetical protein